ncbi:hypothetical protein BGX24_006450 [Mortierella sp. AD032]|nr:hypothetical protein BGX24_006450 [Mortierella sp. AD032]
MSLYLKVTSLAWHKFERTLDMLQLIAHVERLCVDMDLRVFRELAVRSMTKKKSKISLYLKDLDEPQTTNTTNAAKITRKLMDLLSQERKLVITGNEQMEKLLSELANAFSSTISDKNLMVARRISSSM